MIKLSVTSLFKSNLWKIIICIYFLEHIKTEARKTLKGNGVYIVNILCWIKHIIVLKREGSAYILSLILTSTKLFTSFNILHTYSFFLLFTHSLTHSFLYFVEAVMHSKERHFNLNRVYSIDALVSQFLFIIFLTRFSFHRTSLISLFPRIGIQ